ncbi:MAG: alpha/beta fold hydrolase, partial [bacterium]|nr:alpha/beta fold hydrolase [bacterium]
DVSFKAACDGTTQHYVVMLPAPFDKEESHHLIVALHGHGSDRWQFAKSSRDECRAVRDAAARHNTILVSPDYRAKTSWMGPKAEADMLQILEELKKQYRIGKTIISGGSMGASSALTFAALHPDLIDGVFSMNGTANHVEYENFQDAIRASFGGTKQEVFDEYKKRSAEYWPERFTMPVGITASGKDESVPPESVMRLARVLQKMGRDVTVVYEEDEGHSTNYANAMKVLEAIIGKVLAEPAAGENTMLESFTNSIAMRFVRIEAGSFTMGQETGGNWDEQPAHEVRIGAPFHMSASVVTNTQYELFDPEHRKLRGKKGFSKGDDEAVVFVSWHDAVECCEWLSEKEEKPYRVPTEAEWEQACRAGTTTAFSTGDELPEMYHKHQKSEWEPVPVSLRVGGNPANPWGLHGMHGKVEEWCHDWYGPYEAGVQTDPVGRADGDFRVSRGGSHGTELTYLRSANRLASLPEDTSWFIGFRVVQGEAPDTEPLPQPAPERWARDVATEVHEWKNGPAADAPYFSGPRRYVKIPPDSNGPMYSK